MELQNLDGDLRSALLGNCPEATLSQDAGIGPTWRLRQLGLQNVRVWPVVGGNAWWSSGQEDAVAEEVESGASVHLSHDLLVRVLTPSVRPLW
ncbi:hypothetical protein [Streptomyces sp. NPDC048419]|uniref:hypothetical protein n=1 Tax=Streptomyces sp. NPDC048419 TaxID=3365547 RepID=UPI0037210771